MLSLRLGENVRYMYLLVLFGFTSASYRIPVKNNGRYQLTMMSDCKQAYKGVLVHIYFIITVDVRINYLHAGCTEQCLALGSLYVQVQNKDTTS